MRKQNFSNKKATKAPKFAKAKKGINKKQKLLIALMVLMGFLPKIFLTGCPSPTGPTPPRPAIDKDIGGGVLLNAAKGADADRAYDLLRNFRWEDLSEKQRKILEKLVERVIVDAAKNADGSENKIVMNGNRATITGNAKELWYLLKEAALCDEGEFYCRIPRGGTEHIHGELFKFFWECIKNDEGEKIGITRKQMEGCEEEGVEGFIARYEEWLKNPYRDPSREALDEDGITKKKILVPSTRGHEQDGNLLKLRGNATMLDPLWDTRFALVLWFEDRGSR